MYHVIRRSLCRQKPCLNANGVASLLSISSRHRRPSLLLGTRPKRGNVRAIGTSDQKGFSFNHAHIYIVKAPPSAFASYDAFEARRRKLLCYRHRMKSAVNRNRYHSWIRLSGPEQARAQSSLATYVCIQPPTYRLRSVPHFPASPHLLLEGRKAG